VGWRPFRRAFLALHDRAVRNQSGVDKPPQRDDQLARQRHDRDPPDSAFRITDPRVEPSRQAARRLMAEPQPRQFYGVMPSPRIAGLTDPLLAAARAAAVGRRRQADKARDRAPITEGPVEDLGA